MSGQFLSRLRGRIKHGLLMQEVLVRLGGLGVRFMPYLIVDDSPSVLSHYEGELSSSCFRLLDASDMHMVANMPNRKRSLEDAVSRLEYAECLGAFIGDTLAGYTWSRRDQFSQIRGRIQLHQLSHDEAYLFDMYVDRNFRGMSLAPLLRHHLLQHLSSKGVRRFYSITAYFNQSSRKFKAKLGARDLELRFSISFWSRLNADFLLRRYDKSNPIKTKRAYFV